MSRQIRLSKSYSFDETSFVQPRKTLSLTFAPPSPLHHYAFTSCCPAGKQNTWLINCASWGHLNISVHLDVCVDAQECANEGDCGVAWLDFLLASLYFSHTVTNLYSGICKMLWSLRPVTRSFGMWTVHLVLSIYAVARGTNKGPYFLDHCIKMW